MIKLKTIIPLLALLIVTKGRAEDGSRLWLRSEMPKDITLKIDPTMPNDDGYRINGHTITARTEMGLLYGRYALLRGEQGESHPFYKLRILNHWDNLDGSVERGYAGKSIFWNNRLEVDHNLIQKYAEACASIGINGTVLNNVNASPKMLTRPYINRVKEIADILRPWGIKVYLSVNFGSPKALGELKTADPLNPRVRRWWQKKAKEIYKAIPDFGGFLVKANSEGQPGPFDYGRTHADGANMLADALKPYGGIVMWRSFVYGAKHQGEDRVKQAVSEFAELDGHFRDNVILQSKNGPLDFQPREPYAPIFDQMTKTPQMVELQITQEYLGQSQHLVYLAPMWQEFFSFVNPKQLVGIAGVANIGLDVNWCGHHFSGANWYAFGRLAWDPTISSEKIAEEWIQQTFGNEGGGMGSESIWAAITSVMLRSREACVDYMMPLGLHHIFKFDHHMGPDPGGFKADYPIEWCPVYYHRANKDSIGVDRSSSGTNATSQYREPYRSLYDNIDTCPEEYLLWFHRVPWTHRMSSGCTLWEELQNHYDHGVAEVDEFVDIWQQAKPYIDEQRWREVADRLSFQQQDARLWRDVCLEYFGGKAGSAARVQRITLDGYVGHRYKQCLERRVKTENIDTLISVFRSQDEVNNAWGSEFWGKWVQGAIGMYHYTHDSQLYGIIQQAQEQLIACQLPDGYIGDYDASHQLAGWDVWGRKYTILGLLKWYRETGYKPSLLAAVRLLDYTISQVGPNGKSIVLCGYYKGMPPCSILEPVMLMYQTTRDERYLQFAKYIVAEMESPQGPQLIAKADVPACQRFPIASPGEWWGARNGQKAYEMMSCYIGMLELYRETGDSVLLLSAQKAWQHILQEEINICGSGASFECWFGGREQQQRASMHTMETCVTFTWMQFCERLLELTGNPEYADQLERTMYNALMASMKADGSQIVKYTPLEGYRQEGEHQCNLPINCCNANGTRAFAMIPRIMYRLPEPDRIDVNLYIPSTAEIQMGKNLVSLVQETDYPRQDRINISISTGRKSKAFTLALRIPAWSRNTVVEVNGEAIQAVESGKYQLINRTWKTGDRVTLRLDLTARLLQLGDMQAIERGPIVLSRDSRFNDGFVDESCIVPTYDGNSVALEPVEAPNGFWMAFRLRMLRGTYSMGDADKETTHFCDFASAGNTWDRQQRYRVWLPRTLNLLSK